MNATETFSGKAAIYSKYRPQYPKTYIDDLISTACLTKDSVIADIGSGTGIFTKQLLECGFSVFAVEPNTDMRTVAEASLASFPRFTSQSASAEATGLCRHSIDLITVAQAFHWFDTIAFQTECRRILKPGAFVSLVWNSRDTEQPISSESADICRELCPAFRGFSGGIHETDERFEQFFADGDYEKKIFRNDLELDLDRFVGRMLSASYAPKPEDPAYDAFINAFTKLFYQYSDNGMIILPNITQSYIGKV